MSTIEQFSSVVSKDLFCMVTGTQLGEGIARDVYRSALIPSQVFKFETRSGSFQNILEWETWEHVKHTKYRRWFAPCHAISPCGTILIQEYARAIETSELPTHIPAFFTDIKQKNWGMLDGRPVCVDYGYTLLMEKGMTSKLRKAEW